MHVCACVVFEYEYSCLKIKFYKVTCKHTYVDSIVVSFEGSFNYTMSCIEALVTSLSTDQILAKFILLVMFIMMNYVI